MKQLEFGKANPSFEVFKLFSEKLNENIVMLKFLIFTYTLSTILE
jgi:hypothetical protein